MNIKQSIYNPLTGNDPKYLNDTLIKTLENNRQVMELGLSDGTKGIKVASVTQANTSYLYLLRTTTDPIPHATHIFFNNVVIDNFAEYDSSTAEITIKNPGTYIINWLIRPYTIPSDGTPFALGDIIAVTLLVFTSSAILPQAFETSAFAINQYDELTITGSVVLPLLKGDVTYLGFTVSQPTKIYRLSPSSCLQIYRIG